MRGDNKINMIKKLKFPVLAFIFIAFFGNANAKCVMPTADGGGVENVSSRNLAGYIKKFDGRYIHVLNIETKKIIAVDASKIEYIFSAYGGDAPLSKIEPGMATRIWYKNCRQNSNKPPMAAYVEVFIFSGKDDEKMPKDYFTQRGR